MSFVAVSYTHLDVYKRQTDRSVLMWMPLVVIGLMILRGITSYIPSYCISWVSGKVVMTMRRRLFGHMMGMPVSFFDKQSTGKMCIRDRSTGCKP